MVTIIAETALSLVVLAKLVWSLKVLAWPLAVLLVLVYSPVVLVYPFLVLVFPLVVLVVLSVDPFITDRYSFHIRWQGSLFIESRL